MSLHFRFTKSAFSAPDAPLNCGRNRCSSLSLRLGTVIIGTLVGRADSVDVMPVVHFRNAIMPAKEYRQCGRKWTIQPDVCIVPSVGELGWTP